MLAIVAVGVVAGLVEQGRFTYAFGHATLYVLLPALLFEAAWNLDFVQMKRQWRPIALLAGPGVLLSAAVIAAALVTVRAPVSAALLTGALLSATDPIVVIAIFRTQRVPPGLTTIVECEALFNDAVAVLVYGAVLVALSSAPTPAVVAGVAARSIGAAIGGVILGVAIAYATAYLLRTRAHGAPAQILVTMLCAYGGYFLAAYAHCSGIFTVVACGIGLRFFERRWMDLSVASDVEQFWNVVALAANALVFFLIGAALLAAGALRAPLFIVAAVGGVIIGRALLCVSLLPARIPSRWLPVVASAGQRGALSLVLALALPASTPYRAAIIACAFVTVFATLAISSVAVPAALRHASA